MSRRRSLTNMAMAQHQGLPEIPRIPGSNRTRKICRIPGTNRAPEIPEKCLRNRAPEIPEKCLRSSALSQAHLRQPIPGCTDKAQKHHAILLQLSCKKNSAHRCIPFARQLFLFKLAKSLPHARYVKIELPIRLARRSGARGRRPNGQSDG